MYYVYLLQNSRDKSFYIGYSSDLMGRLSDHNVRRYFDAYTASKLGRWELIYYEAYRSKADAIEREAKLKQHGRAKRYVKERNRRAIKAKQGKV